MRTHARTVAIAAGALFAAGCGPKHYLAEYRFADRTIALVYVDPPTPELRTGWYDIDQPRTPIGAVMQAGGAVAKELEARRAHARLDSAVKLVRLDEQLAQRTLERASRSLGTRPVADARDAEFVLEVHLRRFGIDARTNHAAYVFTRAEASILERRTGRQVWRVSVNGRSRMTPWLHGTDAVPSSILTAATLSTVSIEDFSRALDQLATYASNLVTENLREKLREAREGER